MEIKLGKKIRELRREKGLTQEELAVKLSVSPQTVSKMGKQFLLPGYGADSRSREFLRRKS